MDKRAAFGRLGLFAALVAGVLAVSAVISGAAGLFEGVSSPGAHITAEHFVSPRFPVSFNNDFGGGSLLPAALSLTFLILIVAAVLVLPDAGFGEDGPMPVPGPRVGAARFVSPPFAIALAAVFLARMAATHPMTGLNRLSAAGKFFPAFNRAAAMKAKFDEGGYEREMFDALLFNRDDFFRFARSGYWAFYSGQNYPVWTDRKRAAADYLCRLFEAGSLADEDVYQAAFLMKESGDVRRAEPMARYLLAKRPDDERYPVLWRELAAQRQKTGM